MDDAGELRSNLAREAPTLWTELGSRAKDWLAPAKDRLESSKKHGYPKTFNDPIWGDITLYPWETLLLDSPLMQRLRGVRQLGMAHLVYPGAGHDRLEHSRGVVEAAERMMAALTRNAEARRKFGKDSDEHVPTVAEEDRHAIRLAALLHDVGHGAFSHATEMLIASRLKGDFKKAEKVFRAAFQGVKSIAPAEAVAIIIVLSEAFRAVVEHPAFGASSEPHRLPLSICARILGSRDHLKAGYLSGVVSGPLDADKLDYMARDSHHAGLPIGLDLHRLISKLEVVTVTPENASNPEMRSRAESSTHQRFHEIGISLSGLGAYEQMVVARVILYDRLYYHHKIRAAEAMVRRLIRLAEEERGKPFTIQELFFDLPDDTVVPLLGGVLQQPNFTSGGQRSQRLAISIQNRNVYYRAFAFAPRFIAGLAGLPDADRRDARALLWTEVLNKLSSIEGCDELASQIYDKAVAIKSLLGDDIKSPADLKPEDVVVDLPVNKSVVRGGDILTRTEDGHVAPPNLFFDPERWSQAYEHQKQCGFVYTPRPFVRLVGLAARIVFFERFEVVMDTSADRASKTAGDITGRMFENASKAGLCSADLADIYSNEKPRLVPIRVSDLEKAIPEDLRRDDAGMVERLRKEFAEAIPVGLAPSVHTSLLRLLTDCLTFLQAVARTGEFLKKTTLDERSDLQLRFRQHLEARSAKVVEGSEEAGGETDLVLDSLLVIENKVVRSETSTPLTDGPRFSWQARRYGIALAQHVVAEMVAYKPASEAAILPIPSSIAVSRLEQAGDFAVVRFVIPWGHDVPSRAKAPT